ncbi:MAG TPA: hypothetical protein VMV49_02105 [Candidatus Deferrimicrobium sp.]|nr:hypothetical protein [Candidatus Deferrimicrobium sp.]
MSIFSLRISKELKEKMKKMAHINWSEILRSAIEETIDTENTKNLALAVLLNERHLINPDANWNSTDEIRKWREKIRWK